MPYSSSLTDAEWEIIKPLLPQKRELDRPSGVKEKYWMVFCINSRMAVTGRLCPKTYHPTPQYIGIYIQWRAEGVIENIKNILHVKVRKQVKKSASGQL